MKIGIIGTGNIGGTLARLWSKAGHEILISSRHPEALQELAAQLGVQTGTPIQAANFGDVLLISIPLSATVEFDDELKAAISGKPVIDTSNAYGQRDGHVYRNSEPHGEGSSGWVAEVLGHTQIVKAFNTIYYKSLLDDSGRGISIPLASNSDSAIHLVSQLIRDAGYEPFLVGSLAEGRFFEPGTTAYGQTVPQQELAVLIQQEVTKTP